jgi:hypothetical protein
MQHFSRRLSFSSSLWFAASSADTGAFEALTDGVYLIEYSPIRNNWDALGILLTLRCCLGRVVVKGILLWQIGIPIPSSSFFTCSTQSSPFRKVDVRR